MDQLLSIQEKEKEKPQQLQEWQFEQYDIIIKFICWCPGNNKNGDGNNMKLNKCLNHASISVNNVKPQSYFVR